MHNTDACRFEWRLGDAMAVCEYRREGDTLDLHHTFVPDALRGRGVAAILTEEALGYAKAAGLKVIPSCSYIEGYIRKNPAYAGLVAPAR